MAAQQVVKEAASGAMALAVATIVMVALAATTNASRRQPALEVRQKMVIAQFLELKPLIFMGDGKPKMAEQ